MNDMQELIATLRFAAEVFAALAGEVDALAEGMDLVAAASRREALAELLAKFSGEAQGGACALATALGDWRGGTSPEELIATIERENLRLAEKVYFAAGIIAAKEALEGGVEDMEEVLRLVTQASDVDADADADWDTHDGFTGDAEFGSPEDAGSDGPVDHILPERELFPVWFATNRAPADPARPSAGFGRRRSSDGVRFGRCLVHVPQSHRLGSLGSGLLHRIRHGDDGLRVHARETFGPAEFWNRIDSSLTDEERARHAVVFLHGYNVSFDAAALRAAQLGFDLGVRGPMSFFSWPSRGRRLGYIADGNSIEASAQDITDFLVAMATRPGVETVHVIAHSMGNRGALAAVTAIAAEAERLSGRTFGQFVLAAADVDAEVFRQRAAAFGRVGSGTTLYVSPNDLALRFSEMISNFPRVGRVPPVSVVEGVDTIDVGDINLSSLGHGYVGEAVGVLKDMHDLITTGRSPGERFGLAERRDAQDRCYWAFKP